MFQKSKIIILLLGVLFVSSACEKEKVNSMPVEEAHSKTQGITVNSTEDFKTQLTNLEFTQKENFHGIDYNLPKGVELNKEKSMKDQREYIIATEPNTKKNAVIVMSNFNVSSIDKRKDFEAHTYQSRFLDDFLSHTAKHYDIPKEEYLKSVEIETNVPFTRNKKQSFMYRIYDKERNETACGIYTNNGKKILSFLVYMPNKEMESTCLTFGADFFRTIRPKGKPLDKISANALKPDEIKNIKTDATKVATFENLEFKIPETFDKTIEKNGNVMFHSREFKYNERYGMITMLKLNVGKRKENYKKDVTQENKNVLSSIQGDNLKPMMMVSTSFLEEIKQLDQVSAAWNARLYSEKYTLESKAVVFYYEGDAYLVLIGASKNAQDKVEELSKNLLHTIQKKKPETKDESKTENTRTEESEKKEKEKEKQNSSTAEKKEQNSSNE